jgi:hypothetical protein
MIEGGATAVGGNGTVGASEEPVGERNPAERRLAALAAAIREHESRRRHHAAPLRPEDIALYRRLRQVCGEA